RWGLDWRVGPFLPALDVETDHEEPQAERSLAEERGESDPGVQLGCESRCQQSGEAVGQVYQAVDREQDADDSGEEGRPEYEVGQADDVDAEEHRVDGVVDR